ncbi:unannotated protein [freshwater metagenome]|uniref:Unannotated protein n=1 Tax=freshwater metagenome TaxID=449393 RepID=A0A6J7UTZ6_9ZZZZ
MDDTQRSADMRCCVLLSKNLSGFGGSGVPCWIHAAQPGAAVAWPHTDCVRPEQCLTRSVACSAAPERERLGATHGRPRAANVWDPTPAERRWPPLSRHRATTGFSCGSSDDDGRASASKWAGQRTPRCPRRMGTSPPPSRAPAAQFSQSWRHNCTLVPTFKCRSQQGLCWG